MRASPVIATSRAALLAALLSACSSAAGPSPLAESNETPAPHSGSAAIELPAIGAVDYAELRAWEDTRRGLPPLRIVRADSVSAFLAFVNERRGGWSAVAALEGIALPVELHRGSAVADRIGMLERAHGQGGHFVRWHDGRTWTRPATADELGQFMAYFGIGVVIIE